MPLTAEAAALQVTDNLVDLRSLISSIQAERLRNEQCLDELHSAEAGNGNGNTALLRDALSAAVAEEKLVRAALARIHEIRQIKNERRVQARQEGNKETIGCGALMKLLLSAAESLPLHVSKMGEKAPSLCGAVPADQSYIARPGDTVAALVRVSEKEENWILAEVVGWNTIQGKYEVDDIDEEQKNRHILSKRRVVPLPLMRANPATDEEALFPIGSVVMALYPQTTCFYKAVVSGLPMTAADGYEVLFEDSSYDDGYSPPERVAQRYVISIKEGKGRIS